MINFYVWYDLFHGQALYVYCLAHENITYTLEMFEISKKMIFFVCVVGAWLP